MTHFPHKKNAPPFDGALFQQISNLTVLTSARFTSIRVVERAGYLAHGLLLVDLHNGLLYLGSRNFFSMLFNSELDGIGSCLGTQVVHAGFQTFLPSIKMHG